MLKNKMMNCDGCAMAKLCQKNMPKLATMKSKTPGERLFINISHPQTLEDLSIGCSLLTMRPIIVFPFF